MPLITKYVRTSGAIDLNRMDLVHRQTADGSQVESWVIQTKEEATKSCLRCPGRVTGLWRSDAGRGFAVAEGTIYAFRLHTYGWGSYPVEWTPEGVYGIDDRNVWVWGQEYGAGALYRWNGGQLSGNWDEVRGCPGHIRAMHGSAADNVFVVGDGFVARWDGSTWTHEGVRGAERLCSVFALADGTAYACGEDGDLWERDDGKWSKRLSHDVPLAAVVSWRGNVWIGEQGELGLCQLHGDELVSKKPNLPATSLDARQELLFATDEVAGHTKDGEAFRGRAHAKSGLLLKAGDTVTDQISG